MVKFTLKKKITKPLRRNQSLNVFEKSEEAAAKEIQISTVDSTSSTKQNDTNLRIIHPPKDTWSIHAKKHKPSEPEVELPDVADDSDPTADSYQSVPVKDFGIAMLRGMGFQEKGKEKNKKISGLIIIINMAAPTAKSKPTEKVEVVRPQADDEDVIIDMDVTNQDSQQEETQTEEPVENTNTNPEAMVLDESGKPRFVSAKESGMKVKLESRKVAVPPHRMGPLKTAWPKIYPPLVDHLHLQVRMNLRTKTVEMRTCAKTVDPGALQKGADFVKAFTLGFDIDDAIALLRLDDLYIDTFEIKDIKTLHGDHLSRAIGRIAGKDGRTKFAIENATRTRIVLADSKIHILGGFTHIKIARKAVVSLILGSPPGKIYGNLRTVSSRMKERS